MKYLLVLVPVLLLSFVQVQDSWKLVLNGKVLLKTATEDAAKNRVKVHKKDLQKKSHMSVVYTEAEHTRGWERFITVFDTQDRELLQQKGVQFNITNAGLLALFKKSDTLSLYTWSLPTDPKQKALVRVRRVHLCTLELVN
jgi:hypothetical protein